MPPRPRSLLLFFTIIAAGETRPFVIFVTENDFKDTEPDPEGPEPYIYDTPDESTSSSDESSNWDDLGLSNVEIDSGSWSSVMGSEVNFKTENSTTENGGSRELRYARGVRGMIDAVSAGDYVLVEESVNETESVAKDGHAHAQSTMGILYGLGIARPRGQSKAFLYHQFAKDGNLQSKMALAYTYFRQEMYEKAVELYAELAEVAVTSSLMSKEPPVIEVVRIHNGGEENKEGLRMFRGEGSDDFQVTNYLAERGDAGAMYKIGMLYYYGLHGVVQNDEKALHWFSKAVEKGEVRSMELLGEIYARGSVVERNYTMAMQWLSLASHHGLFSANNGMGYLYAKGYGVKNKNHTKAR